MINRSHFGFPLFLTKQFIKVAVVAVFIGSSLSVSDAARPPYIGFFEETIGGLLLSMMLFLTVYWHREWRDQQSGNQPEDSP